MLCPQIDCGNLEKLKSIPGGELEIRRRVFLCAADGMDVVCVVFCKRVLVDHV